jgi:hypothetical protein
MAKKYSMIREPEIWKVIAGYEGLYKISSHGRVMSYGIYSGKRKRVKPPIILQLSGPSKCGRKKYNTALLCKDGEYKSFLVHRLVAFYFVDNPMNYVIVNHEDGDKLNNYFENLKWCTDVQNKQHAIQTGLTNQVGDNSVLSKLNADQVRSIRTSISKATPLAKMYGVSIQTILNVRNRVTYSNII